MQKRHCGEWPATTPFNGEGFKQLVLGGLGCSVAVPAATAVIANAANAGTEAGEMEGAITSQQRFDRSSKQHRRNRVDRELLHQGAALNLSKSLFRNKARTMQSARGIHHQPQVTSLRAQTIR